MLARYAVDLSPVFGCCIGQGISDLGGLLSSQFGLFHYVRNWEVLGVLPLQEVADVSVHVCQGLVSPSWYFARRVCDIPLILLVSEVVRQISFYHHLQLCVLLHAIIGTYIVHLLQYLPIPFSHLVVYHFHVLVLLLSIYPMASNHLY